MSDINEDGFNLRLCSTIFDTVPYLYGLSLDSKLTAIFYEYISCLKDLKQLTLHGPFVTEFYFTNIRELDLSDTSVSDVSALVNCHTLNLSYTKVTDVSSLARVHCLNIAFTDVDDVSSLGQVHTLNISNTKVTDVSRLGKVNRCLLNMQFIL